MHFDDMIDPIWERFSEYKHKYSDLGEMRAEKAAFYWAIKDSVEQLQSETMVDPYLIEKGGDDYIKHMEEKRGYDIGRAINENSDVHYKITKKDHYGARILKRVFVIKINQSENQDDE